MKSRLGFYGQAYIEYKVALLLVDKVPRIQKIIRRASQKL